MKRTATYLAASVFGALVALAAPAAPPDRAADVRKTVDAALRPGAGETGEASKALAHLVAIAGGIARDAKLAGPARAKVDVAVEKTAKAGAMDPASVAAIAEAYTALNGGREFSFPADVKKIDDAKGLVRSLSEKSLKALEAGRTGEAARDLLGCVLAVVTPMEAGP